MTGCCEDGEDVEGLCVEVLVSDSAPSSTMTSDLTAGPALSSTWVWSTLLFALSTSFVPHSIVSTLQATIKQVKKHKRLQYSFHKQYTDDSLISIQQKVLPTVYILDAKGKICTVYI